MNREGLCSLLGFYALFLIAAQIGAELLSDKSPRDTRSHKHRVLLKYLVLLSFALIITERLNLKVSRRLVISIHKANLSFCLWVSCSSVFLLYGFFLIDKYLLTPNHTPLVFQAVNRNQLAIFLASNLLTGGINLTIDTLSCSDPVAMCILATYMLLVCVIAVQWHHWGWTIKL
jgi:phosphatidylinositol glycan class W